MEFQQKFWTQKLRWAPWLAGILCMCYRSYGQEEVMSFMAPQGEDNQKLHIFPDLVPLCLFLWRVLICIPNFNNMTISLVAFRGTFLMGIHCRGWRHGFNPWVRKIPWKRKWQPSPIFLPGKSHRQRSLVGYSPKGCKELDMAEWLSMDVIAFSEFWVLLPNFETCGWFWETHWVSEILARLSSPEDCLIWNSSETNSIDYSQMILLDTEKIYINWQIII